MAAALCFGLTGVASADTWDTCTRFQHREEGYSGLTSGNTPYVGWTHPGGKPGKMVQVKADNNAEAVRKAVVKFRSIRVKPVGVTCRW